MYFKIKRKNYLFAININIQTNLGGSNVYEESTNRRSGIVVRKDGFTMMPTTPLAADLEILRACNKYNKFELRLIHIILIFNAPKLTSNFCPFQSTAAIQ